MLLSLLVRRSISSAFRLLALAVWLTIAVRAQTTVLTYHDNNARTGADLTETQLTPGHVTAGAFGLLARDRVDGDIYAQPLYLPAVRLPNGATRALVFVATEDDSIYAFDARGARDGQGTTPVWVDHFADPRQGTAAQTAAEVHCQDIQPAIGITGTPVIDPATGSLYAVAAMMDHGQPQQRLYAVDVATGAERAGSPVDIAASVRVAGASPEGGRLDFDALAENQRAGLLLSHGLVYAAWGSHCDRQPFHGWLMAFSARTLRLASAFVSTPETEGGGFWGGAPAADADGNIYLSTGNLGFVPGVGQWGESVLRMTLLHGELQVAGYFAPWDADHLSAINADLSSQGIVLLPAASSYPGGTVVAGDKAGDLYVLDPLQLGGYVAGPGPDRQILEELPGATAGVIGTPAYWDGNLYLLGTGEKASLGSPLQAFALRDGRLESPPVAATNTWFRFPAGVPVVSANGGRDGIVWLLQCDAWARGGPEVLHAYNARTLQELYNSGEDRRDQAGPAVKFAAPAIADGEVFVPAAGELDIYGMRAPAMGAAGFRLSASPTAASVRPGESAHYTLTLAPRNGWTGRITLRCTHAPLASSCAVSPTAIRMDQNPQNARVTVATTAASSAAAMLAPAEGSGPAPWIAWLALLLLPLAGMSSRRRWVMALAVAGLALALAACGGHPTGPVGTPPGTDHLTITATSGSLAHTLSLTLVVR